MREQFEKIARKFIKRGGIEDLLSALAVTDFYTAPASTKYHDSHEGGLVKHSLRVFAELDSMTCSEEFSRESVAIVSLFHDLCKMGFYKVEMRNTKDERGKWIQVPYYTVEDKLPYGHGEKSVFILQEYLKLTLEESMAIRWHMGGFEPKEHYVYLNHAFKEFPLALHLHVADMRASYLE